MLSKTQGEIKRKYWAKISMVKENVILKKEDRKKRGKEYSNYSYITGFDHWTSTNSSSGLWLAIKWRSTYYWEKKCKNHTILKYGDGLTLKVCIFTAMIFTVVLWLQK